MPAAGVMVWLPLVAWLPLQLPDAVQLVVLTEDQVSVVELPAVRDVAPTDTLGAAGGSNARAASAWMKP